MKPYLRLIRLHQWHKNAFVLLGFFLLGDYANSTLLLHSVLAALTFCFISSAVYIINDLVDSRSDRHHPIKKNRPLAAGTVRHGVVYTLLILLITAGFSLAFLVGIKIVVIITVYLLNNLLYSFFTKKLAIIDVFQIAFGFMLRIFAGTVGVGIFISEWMVITGFMLSLLIGFAKRFVELANAKHPRLQRAALKFYARDTLQSFIVIMAAATIITYGLYTLSPRSIRIHDTTQLIYTAPLVVFGVLRFVFLTFAATSDEDPATYLRSDTQLLSVIVLWTLSYGFIIA